MQGVTDMKCATGCTIDSRNGGVVTEDVTDTRTDTGVINNFRNPDSLEDATAKINAIARFGMSEAEMDRVDLTRKAQKSCGFCGTCGREIDKGETIWRVYIGLGYGFFGRIWTVAPVCEQCRPRYRRYLLEQSCGHCGRGVINENNGRRWYRKNTVCSESYDYEYRQVIKKQGRQHTECVCRVCEKSFRPSRRDALHCSSACRQRDYRRRKQEGTEKEARAG